MFVDQAYTTGHVCGILRHSDNPRDDQSFGGDDIVFTRNVPADLRVTAGLITAQLQTPLCHVGLLCANRGTPNVAVLDSALDKVVALISKPVFFCAAADGLHIEEISSELCSAVIQRKRQQSVETVQCPPADVGGFPGVCPNKHFMVYELVHFSHLGLLLSLIA